MKKSFNVNNVFLFLLLRSPCLLGAASKTAIPACFSFTKRRRKTAKLAEITLKRPQKLRKCYLAH